MSYTQTPVGSWKLLHANKLNQIHIFIKIVYIVVPHLFVM